MKLKLLIASVCTLFVVSSCIKDEPLNREADIVSFTFQNIAEEPYIKDDAQRITVTLNDADITRLTPIIKVSEGATLSPASGVEQDFSVPVIYTVTSQDGEWVKKYTVVVSLKDSVPPVEMDTIRYDFDDWLEINDGFVYPAINDDLWDSANPGIALAKIGNVDFYPTRPTTDSYHGPYAALLETQRGGTFWNNLIPVFSGSLFRGTFNINISNFAKSAKFGQPHPKEKGKPVEFKGYYKYKVGSPFYDENDNIVDGKIDECSIYAVLYKVAKSNAGKTEYLDGTNVMNSDKVIAKAELSDRSARSSYTEFKLSFIYTEEPDYDAYDYKLAVVFASSRDGDQYRGAIGSTLIVDKVEVICRSYTENE
ncbi:MULTISPECIES: PCMD domain-containing protein [unclassified Dysgonomonas]|uniref:PCMD domain-containing protein n=1 Tax=unclassified Dysgonomonas TaxID=2630389 RepID=UPI002475EC42|nr:MULTISPECIES: PCMD domain-containing protein [unclassified Dysgonomonas]